MTTGIRRTLFGPPRAPCAVAAPDPDRSLLGSGQGAEPGTLPGARAGSEWRWRVAGKPWQRPGAGGAFMQRRAVGSRARALSHAPQPICCRGWTKRRPPNPLGWDNDVLRPPAGGVWVGRRGTRGATAGTCPDSEFCPQTHTEPPSGPDACPGCRGQRKWPFLTAERAGQLLP